MSVEDFRDFFHIRLPLGWKRTQLFKEFLKVCARHDCKNNPAGGCPDVAERMRNALGKSSHGTGRDLLSLLIELEFKFTLDKAKELVFLTMHATSRPGLSKAAPKAVASA